MWEFTRCCLEWVVTRDYLHCIYKGTCLFDSKLLVLGRKASIVHPIATHASLSKEQTRFIILSSYSGNNVEYYHCYQMSLFHCGNANVKAKVT